MTPNQKNWRRIRILLAAWLVWTAASVRALAVQDVMLQTMDGKIVTGIVDDTTGIGTLGTRVYRGNFLSIFAASNPGFFGLTSVNPNLPPGASGFPSNHDVFFDLLPMQIGAASSNLFYWNGSDAVQFVVPANVTWEVKDGSQPTSQSFFADGSDQLVSGGLIQRTSSDTNPSDGVDTGALHKHLALALHATSGNPPAGIYVIAWQARSAGFDASEPFLFVHRTSSIADATRDLAAQWLNDNLASLFGPELPGDYNGDNLVDALDYAVWRNSLGQGITLPNEAASPHFVDEDDFDVWKINYGETAAGGGGGSGLAGVPEFGTLTMCSIAALVAALASRHRGDCSDKCNEDQR